MMKPKYKMMFVGGVLSLLAPLGLWVFLELTSVKPASPMIKSYLYVEMFAFIVFCLFGLIIGRYKEKIIQLAFVDPLTSLPGRQYLLSRIDELVRSNEIEGDSFSLLLFDIDLFKQINDNHGFSAGDVTLKQVARCVAKQSRRIGVAGRYGADTFLVVCPRIGTVKSAAIAEKIRREVSKLGLKALGYDGKVTVSAAVYEIIPGLKVSAEELLNILKHNVADAKIQGRNRVVVNRE